MEYEIERLEMTGRGVRVMWAIKKDGVRQFPTDFGHSAWTRKKDAMSVLRCIEKHGYKSTKERIDIYD